MSALPLPYDRHSRVPRFNMRKNRYESRAGGTNFPIGKDPAIRAAQLEAFEAWVEKWTTLEPDIFQPVSDWMNRLQQIRGLGPTGAAEIIVAVLTSDIVRRAAFRADAVTLAAMIAERDRLELTTEMERIPTYAAKTEG